MNFTMRSELWWNEKHPDEPVDGESYHFSYKLSMYVIVCHVHGQQNLLPHILNRISKEKWPKERSIQWLQSLPEGSPALLKAEQADDRTVALWETHANKHKRYFPIQDSLVFLELPES